MVAKHYKRQKKGVGRFVQLPEWVQASEAWATLKPAPRALYIELKRRYNGSNNGRIILSHRDAAKALGVHRNTVGPWFEALEERGFIRMTRAPHLGPSGLGQTSQLGAGGAAHRRSEASDKKFHVVARKNKTPA